MIRASLCARSHLKQNPVLLNQPRGKLRASIKSFVWFTVRLQSTSAIRSFLFSVVWTYSAGSVSAGSVRGWSERTLNGDHDDSDEEEHSSLFHAENNKTPQQCDLSCTSESTTRVFVCTQCNTTLTLVQLASAKSVFVWGH